MTKENFIEFFIENGVPKSYCPNREYFDKHFVALPCECSNGTEGETDDHCIGWAAVENNPDAIKFHNLSNNPETRDKFCIQLFETDKSKDAIHTAVDEFNRFNDMGNSGNLISIFSYNGFMLITGFKSVQDVFRLAAGYGHWDLRNAQCKNSMKE